MRITATAILAFTAVASAKKAHKADGARKLANNNNAYNNGNNQDYNQDYNQGNNQGNNGDNQYKYEYSGYYNSNGNSGNINDYMSNLNYYVNARDQKSQYGYYSQGAREYDEEQQDWQQSMQGQRSWGSAYYGQGSSATDTRWMGDYEIKFDGCATDYDSNRYGQAKTELLAKFKLCPSGSSNCRRGGEYVVPMTDYINAFENLVMTDSNCAAQQEICYNQCLMKSRYGEDWEAEDYGGRRLSNNNNNKNNNNKNNQNQNENSAYYQAKQQYYQYHNYNYDKNQEWQEQYEEKQKQYQEEYGYTDDEYKQAKASYYGNIDYSQYNGGNYANAWHNGQYNADANNKNDDFDYEAYMEYINENYNNENNNYYNRENSNWRVNNYFDEEYCRYDCMTDAGMSYCIDNGQNANDDASAYNGFSDVSMVECHQLDYYTYNSQPLYVGAACRDGGVYLETFTDAACTQVAPEGTHEAALGYSLPSYNLVSEEPLSCGTTLTYMHNQYFDNWEEMNYYAQSQSKKAISVCDALYSNSGKCEARMKISEKNNAGCDYIHRMSPMGRFSNWLHYGIGLVVAACLLLAAYIGYSRAKTEDLHITVRTITSSVEGQVNQVSSSVNAILQQAGKALKEPLAPTSDDATVTSADSGPTTHYQAATVPGTPAEQPPTEAAVV